ncbi:Olfactory receptor 14C36 [Sciurus carolinensis]|uniref:Olfactory receptor 14C36 n=1 Tax=Sciurus carolinensis TaxID=30640 RepID=A0AA41MN64_SCICA|nr:Olfactory receptor 14C36 [Sciurus carolinensis]
MSFLYLIVFNLTFLGTLLDNLLIITVTTADQNLHTPMYFFLRNLSILDRNCICPCTSSSILDLCFISITVLNDCVNSITGNRAISVAGCATQLFLVIYCICVELLFLSIMAWDCYVAIFQPFQYPIIMNPQFCVCMTLASLLSGLAYAGVQVCTLGTHFSCSSASQAWSIGSCVMSPLY